MDLNPLTYIEKYITEHGSAAVLEKHLALIRDQLADAEQRVIKADGCAAFAEQRLVKTDQRLVEATQRLAESESRIIDLEKQLEDWCRVADGLNEEETKVIQFFFQFGGSSREDAASSLRIPLPEVTHHSAMLIKRGFLRQSKAAAGRGFLAKYKVTPDGSSHIMKNR